MVGEPGADVLVLVGGVVVHHQVQLDRLPGLLVDGVTVGLGAGTATSKTSESSVPESQAHSDATRSAEASVLVTKTLQRIRLMAELALGDPIAWPRRGASRAWRQTVRRHA